VRSAPLTSRERSIAEYAVKLALHPAEMTAADVASLRQAGLSDAEVLDVCQIAAYFSFVNRMAHGLGVELESYWSEDRGL
jgi:uncharacterized peroxidase-related enzyme